MLLLNSTECNKSILQHFPIIAPNFELFLSFNYSISYRKNDMSWFRWIFYHNHHIIIFPSWQILCTSPQLSAHTHTRAPARPQFAPKKDKMENGRRKMALYLFIGRTRATNVCVCVLSTCYCRGRTDFDSCMCLCIRICLAASTLPTHNALSCVAPIVSALFSIAVGAHS